MHEPDFIDKKISKAFNFINEDKFNKAEQIIEDLLNASKLKENLKTRHFQNIADICLTLGKFDLARDIYVKADNPSGAAFALIILKEIQEAKKILLSSPDSAAKFWCEFLIELFSGNKDIHESPSFFTIRNFLELTVYSLLRAGNQDYIKLLIEHLNKLLDINQDSEKFIGYAYFHFGDLDRAVSFLNSAIKRNSYDGEIYFTLGQLYLQKGSVYGALAMLENAHLLLPDHAPTKELLDKTKSVSEA